MIRVIALHLYYFLLCVTSLACGSLPPEQVDMSLAATATITLISGWTLLSHVAARMVSSYVKSSKLEPLVGAEWLEKQLAAFRWMGLGVSILCLAGFGLARGLEYLPIIGESMFLQACILLTPGILITVGTWSAEHLYGVKLNYTQRGIKNYAGSLWASFRSGMSWLVIPILMLLGLNDIVAMLPINAEIGQWLMLGCVITFVVVLLPWMIRFLFKTKPIEGDAAKWVAELVVASNVGRARCVRWDTGGATFNAMVAGFMPPIRTLFLSDRVLDELPTKQIAMIVLHELAHLKRRHVPLRLAAVLPAWGAATLTTKMADGQPWAIAAGSVIGILLTLAILRFVAYRTEHDADVVACRMAVDLSGRFEQLPQSYDEAADVLGAALKRVTFDQPAARMPTWLHPGVEERIEHMKAQLDAEPAFEPIAGVIGGTRVC